MDANLRIVTQLPLEDGSPDATALESHRVGGIGAARIRTLLREEEPRFVVADVGLPFQWIALAERFSFWKEEVQSR